MLNHVIMFSLQHRWFVLLMAAVAMIYGGYQLGQLPLDVFPDLNRPTVTVMTEAPGLAPEEVEVLVTRQLEYLLNGSTGVKRVRSGSGVGLSIIWVEFDWGTDIFRDRQIVSEKLQLASARLPQNVIPTMAPISSIMGEIMLVGVRTRDLPNSEAVRKTQAMELRTLAEFSLRNRLLAIEGVSQVTVMGGLLKQYQIMTSPAKLAAHGISLQQLTEASQKANALNGGGIVERGEKESLIRINGQTHQLAQLEESIVEWRNPRPVYIRDVADVQYGAALRRGDGGLWIKVDGEQVGGDAVILAIQKQPHADTLTLDKEIRQVLASLQLEIPTSFVIEPDIFRQANFIQAAVDNIIEAVRDGALWVVIILFLFMWNFRVSVSSLTAMPLSILLTFLVFRWANISINTMTMGGIAVAIGDLVDDSIVDIENIYRRLRMNRRQSHPLPALQVVFQASSEVRNSIVYATLIVIVVVLPLFVLDGLEGRMFAPLGLAYVISLLSSLLVSLTVTPVLGYLLLPQAPFLDRPREPWLLRMLKGLVEKMLRYTLCHANMILLLVGVSVTISLASMLWMGGEFLPPFNEGTLTINVQTEPGTSLTESQRLARQLEQQILDVPEVVSVSRRTGRAELDEHAEGVNSSELDVRLIPNEQPKPGWGYVLLRGIPFAHMWGYEKPPRSRESVLANIRDQVTEIPGVKVNVGQPISHRIDHIMSGVRAQVVIKIFGPDLHELRALASDLHDRIAAIPGIVDLQIEPQVEISQIRLRVKHEEAARYGLAVGDITEMLETAYKGRVVSQILEDDRYFSLVVWFDESSRNSPEQINQTILDTPSGRKIALGQVAELLDASGPNTINREDMQRRIAVFCNVAGRDLSRVVGDIKREIAPLEQQIIELPGDYRVELGGQFQAQQQANLRLLVLGSLAIVVVFLLLYQALQSWIAALQVLANIPLAALGSILALMITHWPSWESLQAAAWWEWPRVWIGATHFSVAHGVGFITLIGIVTRNGIMMISHYIHLMKHEGETFGESMIIRGSLERLAPVMMTAMTSFVGLLPLLFGAGQSGNEILHPLAVVVFGGMLASTLLDQMVTPALFLKFGKRVASPMDGNSGSHAVQITATSKPSHDDGDRV
jgi:CzcA family heavy metal efflux pump